MQNHNLKSTCVSSGHFVKKVMWLLIVLAVVMGLSATLWAGLDAGAGSQSSGVTAAHAFDAVDLRTAIAQVAETTIPAVVHIEVTERRENARPMAPFADEPLFKRFFGFPQMPRKFKREIQGLGSGMIIDAKGHILTNNHVVGGATRIEVIMADGTQYPATLIGADPKTDLAVLKISATSPLPHITFGNSDTLRVGEWVVAIGHPRGLDQTVTQGIISAKHRTGITDPSSYQDFLQTDAAINPGNSGGPLLDLDGKVIGINAAIVSRSGGFEGIGFAIPSSMARYVAAQLIAHGEVARGWLGVTIQDLSSWKAAKAGRDNGKGVVVVDVVQDGPADRAGIRKDDIIIAYGGNDIVNAAALRNVAALTTIGEDAQITVMRDGMKKELTVTVGNRKDAVTKCAASLKTHLGGEFRPVKVKESRKYRLPPHQGVVIVSLDSEGPLGKTGFEPNDVILRINGEAIRDMESFAACIDTLKPGQDIILHAVDHRTGRQGRVGVEVG